MVGSISEMIKYNMDEYEYCRGPKKTCPHCGLRENVELMYLHEQICKEKVLV